MLKKPAFSILLALLLFAVFAVGLARLFILRYEVGDVYPPYCSLRADPLGTKALADALGDLPGVEVRRNFKALQKLRPDGPVTLVYAGVTHQAYWTEGESAAFDSIVAGGSRAVFTFLPARTPRSPNDEKHTSEAEREKKKEKVESGKSGAKKKKKKKGGKADGSEPPGKKSDKKAPADKEDKEDEMPEAFVKFDDVASKWGFTFAYLPEQKGKPYDRVALRAASGGNLEGELPWHSALYFRDIDPKWKVLYTCEEKPVVIERPYGGGSIVLMADSFLVSNEALSGERKPHLLARLFTGPPLVIFDEEHNGIREDPGIASLARKYRLHGVVAGLILLAGLFVWKNAARFIPPLQDANGGGDVVAGKEAGEGFVNLLRRAIRPTAIFETCVTEWRKAFSHKPREVAKVEEIWAGEQIRPARERDPVAAYRAISRALIRKV